MHSFLNWLAALLAPEISAELRAARAALDLYKTLLPLALGSQPALTEKTKTGDGNTILAQVYEHGPDKLLLLRTRARGSPLWTVSAHDAGVWCETQQDPVMVELGQRVKSKIAHGAGRS